jgi:hypothetical protein
MSKTPHKCPLCAGTGTVSARVAAAKIDIRDRAKYNETMRKYSALARAKKKTKEALATT